jgi:acyl-CoA reductase-like NAD-dependent aldehyde dehydrogenase
MTARRRAGWQLDALGPKGAYRTRTRLAIPDVAGQPFAETSLVPAVYVTAAMASLRRAEPLSADERISAIARAGELFATGVVCGQSAEEYAYAVCRVSGLPISVVRAAMREAAHRLARIPDSMRRARPSGAVTDWRDPLTRTGCAAWTRRGDVFSVHASGAHPGAHSLWPEALALGYRVAVRPTRREPFTPHRLVTALRLAGFPGDHVALLPTGHDAGTEILRQADLAYGGDEVIRTQPDATDILRQQPGRSKILLGADVDWRDYVDTIVDSVSHHAGAGCVNTTAVLVEGDPAPVAQAVAERLSMIPSLPPEDEKAALPVQPVAAARVLEQYLLGKAAGTRAWLGGAGIVAELGDGSAALRPAVHQVDGPGAEQAGVELAFPCVWIAPWTARAGIGPLRNTLVLTAITSNERLIDALLAEPTIGNLYLGDHPTYWTEPGLPHDGYLADFLMRTKAVVRG